MKRSPFVRASVVSLGLPFGRLLARICPRLDPTAIETEEGEVREDRWGADEFSYLLLKVRKGDVLPVLVSRKGLGLNPSWAAETDFFQEVVPSSVCFRFDGLVRGCALDVFSLDSLLW